MRELRFKASLRTTRSGSVRGHQRQECSKAEAAASAHINASEDAAKLRINGIGPQYGSGVCECVAVAAAKLISNQSRG